MGTPPREELHPNSGAFYDYLLALWQNWVWFVTGGPFLAERLARQFRRDYERLVLRNTYHPRHERAVNFGTSHLVGFYRDDSVFHSEYEMAENFV